MKLLCKLKRSKNPTSSKKERTEEKLIAVKKSSNVFIPKILMETLHNPTEKPIQEHTNSTIKTKPFSMKVKKKDQFNVPMQNTLINTNEENLKIEEHLSESSKILKEVVLIRLNPSKNLENRKMKI